MYADPGVLVLDEATSALDGITENVVMENIWDRRKPIYPRGQIELQNHGNTLWFRNVYIKELVGQRQVRCLIRS